MLIDLYDTSEMIRQNNLKQVSDPIMFIKGNTPSPNGLLSTDIFGVSMRDRKETFACIDLKSIFIQPFIYKLLKRIDRNFESCVHGSKTFKIVDGKLSEDPDGSNGIQWIYDNWSKFKFETTDVAGSRETRIHVLKNYNKNELFTRYWIVMPAFYRDVNFENMDSGKVSHRSEINDKYTKLLRLSSMITTDGGFDFVLSSTKAKIQDTLVELYDFLKSKLAKKEGMLRKNLLGKSTDYSSRCVISAPTFKANRPSEMTIDYYHTGVPLSHCISMFNPFIVAWVRNYFRQIFETEHSKIPYKTKDGKILMYTADEPELYFTDELIKKEIDNFIKNFHDRFKVIKVPVKSPEGVKTELSMQFAARDYNESDPSTASTITRPLTWCDIFYQAAVAVTEDKHVYITRYPISDYFSVFPSGIFVMSTSETVAISTGDKVYLHYPKINLDMPKTEISVAFIDTLRMSNTYLLGLGGDYDGDQVSIRGIFTQEANEEARRQMRSKARILSITGDNMRDSHHEPIQTLYSMTKF